jgi:hypothetical protein
MFCSLHLQWWLLNANGKFSTEYLQVIWQCPSAVKPPFLFPGRQLCRTYGRSTLGSTLHSFALLEVSNCIYTYCFLGNPSTLSISLSFYLAQIQDILVRHYTRIYSKTRIRALLVLPTRALLSYPLLFNRLIAIIVLVYILAYITEIFYALVWHDGKFFWT